MTDTKKCDSGTSDITSRQGNQRLSLDRLRWWEGLGYGMFIHFGMSTYVNLEGKVFFKPDGSDPPARYAPDRLDVNQWVSAARDAGMKYAVLTAKHISGFCLWPSKHTDYSVTNSGNTTNVVEEFVDSCRRCEVLPALYYSAYDNHHRYGSRTRSDFASKKAYFEQAKKRIAFGGREVGRQDDDERMPYTTSHYQSFMTAQIKELLTEYGSLLEIWIDHPDAVGRGYRTFLYNYMAELQSEIMVMMNNGTPSSEGYDIDYAWPSDLIAMEEGARSGAIHEKWRTIEGKEYYLPGEVCDSIAAIRQDWFYLEDDEPRPTAELAEQFQACRKAGVNYLLNVPPVKHGLIPSSFIEWLNELRKEAGI
ncbi:MAG: alpha-L-fucosidase [Planctomycetota bacterium]|nr:MAG: alpha-L-fucosidase [Planctomycetota bacterium]